MNTLDEVQRLKNRVQELESDQRITDTAIANTFRLTKRNIKLLTLLYKLPLANADTISQRIGVGDVKVAVFRLRRKLEEQGYEIDIQSRRNVGYWMTDESRLLIRSIIQQNHSKLEPVYTAA